MGVFSDYSLNLTALTTPLPTVALLNLRQKKANKRKTPIFLSDKNKETKEAKEGHPFFPVEKFMGVLFSPCPSAKLSCVCQQAWPERDEPERLSSINRCLMGIPAGQRPGCGGYRCHSPEDYRHRLC